jgi:hypothetical protein
MQPNTLQNWCCVFQSLTTVFRHAADIHRRQTAVCLLNKQRQLDYEGRPVVDTQNRNTDRPTSDSLQHTSSSSPSPPLAQQTQGITSDYPVLLDHQDDLQLAPVLRASKIPSSRLGRLFHYGGEYGPQTFNSFPQFRALGLAVSLGYGAASEALRRSSQTDHSRAQTASLLMTEANLNRLVSKLSQMRGAALKMGQFMSIQGMIASHNQPCLCNEIAFFQTRMFYRRRWSRFFVGYRMLHIICRTGRWRYH